MLYGKGGWLFRISLVTLETMVTTSTPITRNDMNSKSTNCNRCLIRHILKYCVSECEVTYATAINLLFYTAACIQL
ncbi:hypothetical protein HBI56_041420 [Parastagonospora nodorum]|uniref:Secreted protein n=1 Tax=Phaeosphaeria nodorum (strain SN15 / ATCC MYA-4574 / FGSC 10173) TaxID=321614 RepID=A0A7U2HVD2_PHANO|nr:hypothetical protein HBH56_065340 [Parastagonospora nodorum]QRC93255.1 hypothetical protein JI435_403480 [Parastagonospora nodorum SN15]KAH3932624.1 hypothetical protein HBH54_082750 [Parastagonospora nodorum]KAH3954733.1 hypothetical protein HBH53_011640 [Parastagonospora nodorum]KAH4109868.1 hypothetical protein HBH46_025830 [Parastagonospora nodorum]